MKNYYKNRQSVCISSKSKHQPSAKFYLHALLYLTDIL